MKVISERAPLSETCRSCNSTYEIQVENVSAKVDWLGNEPNLGAPDYTCSWSCPVCHAFDGKWLHELPREWREKILKRNNLVGRAPCYGRDGWPERKLYT